MNLSPRAAIYLKKQQRYPAITDREGIIASFSGSKAPLFEPLIRFQQCYGGYELYAGLEPVHFGLLKGGAGYPPDPGACYVDFEQWEAPPPAYHFNCASTRYQMHFTLDEAGNYYEDFEPKHTSFDQMIEELAILDEIGAAGDFEIVQQRQQYRRDDLQELMSLRLMPEASDQYMMWYSSDEVYLKQHAGTTTLYMRRGGKWKDLVAHWQ